MTNPDQQRARQLVMQALGLHQSGRTGQAQRLYRQALRLDPQDPHAHHYLGLLLLQGGNRTAALEHLRQASRILPENADILTSLGQALATDDQHEAALKVFQQALRLNPGVAEIQVAMANCLQATGRYRESESAYREALERRPESAPFHYNLATLLARQNRWAEAEKHCRRAIRLAPRHAEFHGQLADILLNQNRNDEALACLRQGLKVDPRQPELLYNLGFALAAVDRLEEARDAYQQALTIEPRHGAALSALLYLKRQLADWRGLPELSHKLHAAVEQGWPQISPFSYLAEDSGRRLQLRCARRWSQGISERAGIRPATAPAYRPAEIITVGYLSADFYRHPTAYLAAGLFEQHDRRCFRVIAYSNSRDDGSRIRQRLENGFDEFVDIREMSVRGAAERIRADGVDILVDLKGHTLEAATAIMALRPAPVQVNYLGYPGSMGAGYIDYIIGDPVVTPFEHAADYDEHIVQLPGCYQVNDPQRPCPDEVPSRESLGLPADKLVFCCFNNSWKINPEIFADWMKILRAVPDSVLWLHARQARTALRQNLQARMRSAGVDPRRLVLATPRPLEDYLRLYHLADLFLDTCPYNAHTTASDALWMGCPVISLQGESFAARVGASLLRAVELPELVCTDHAEYRRLAIRLAENPAARQKLRRHLTAGRSRFRLFDCRRFTRDLETAYRQMLDDKQRNTRRPFAVTESGRIVDGSHAGEDKLG